VTVPTFANLGGSTTPDINDAADLSSYTGSSFTPPTAGLAYIFVLSRVGNNDPNHPAVSGWGIDWIEIASIAHTGDNVSRLTLLAANLSGATAGALTVAFGGQTQQCCSALVAYATDVDLSGGVAAAFVQTPTSTATGTGTSGSVTLASASHADNRPIAGFWHRANEATTPRTNWTELDDIAGAGPTRGTETQYRADAFETTASASWSGNVAWLGIAAEIKGAVSGGISGSASITQADNTVSAAGVLPLAGVVSQTQSNNTLSATGALSITGILSTTQAGDVLSAAGTLPITGALDASQEGDGLSATGALAITGESDVTQDDNTIVASGTGSTVITGEAAITQDDNTLAAAGTLQITGVLSVTQDDNSITFAGVLPIEGELSKTQDDNILVAESVLAITGALVAIQEDNILIATNIESLGAHYIYLIPAENRIYAIPASEAEPERILSIVAEDRTTEVEHA
jgi:hypothetical protein